MPKFAYSAIDASGAEIEGTTKADTLGSARSILVEQNLFPIRIEESKGMLDFELTKEKAKKKNLMNFTRQLSVFVKAGIPITDAAVPYGTPAMAAEVARLCEMSDMAQQRIFSMGGHEDGIVAFGKTSDQAGTILLAALDAARA